MALTNKLTAIANAIRAKTGGTAEMTLDSMPTEIASITAGMTVQSISRSTYNTFNVSSYVGNSKNFMLIFNAGTLGSSSSYTSYVYYNGKYGVIKNNANAANGVMDLVGQGNISAFYLASDDNLSLTVESGIVTIKSTMIFGTYAMLIY